MKADILACWDNTWIDKIIRWVTKQKVTHIAVVIDDEFIMETGWFGVKLSKISSKRKQYYVLRCTNLTEHDKDAIVSYAKRSVDIPYDYKQFIEIGLYRLFRWNTNLGEKKKFICVELALEAYLNRGIELLPGYLERELIIPSDLLNSPYLTNIGEGVLG